MVERSHQQALHIVVSQYCAAWNEPDATQRRHMLEGVMEGDAVYVDPGVKVSGLSELVTYIGVVASRRPGSRILLTSDVDAHHALLRFSWRRAMADGTEVAAGIDIAELSGSGKLQRIIGFVGHLPPLITSTHPYI